MAYDALAESVRLIDDPHRAEAPPRLSRRRRSAALAVDVDGDVAATLFVRRGAGGNRQETHVLVREGGRWRLLGGGAGPGPDDVLSHRPPVGQNGQLEPLVLHGTASAARPAVPAPGSGRQVFDSVLRAAHEVRAVQVADRTLPVAWHGWLVIVWGSARAPVAVALDAEGGAIARVRLGFAGARMPLHYRDGAGPAGRFTSARERRVPRPGVAPPAI